MSGGKKSSHILKQICSFQLQVCFSMCDLFVTTRHQRVNGHANVIRHLNWSVSKHALISCCLKAVHIFKRLCQILNRNYVCIMRFHIYSKKFSSWFTVSGVEWGWFFVFFTHDISDIKVSKLCPLLKSNTLNI